jgi:hypothetical protein
MPRTEVVTKLDAARRQLATAIELWFHDKDEVSIHALAFASYEVIDAVSKKRGRTQDLIFDAAIVKDQYRTEFKDFVKKSANFFKHADRDPDAIIEFQLELTRMFILFAILGLHSIGISPSKHELAFTWWICLNHPEMLTHKGHDFITKSIPVDALDEIRSLTKGEFFDVFLQTR